MRNKLETVEDVISVNLEVILLLEAKLNNSSPLEKFILNVYFIIYRVGRISKGNGLLCNEIPQLRSECNAEPICIKLNLKKWNKGSLMAVIILLKDSNHLECFYCITSNYSKMYRSLLLFSYFNLNVNEISTTEFGI